MRNLRECLLFYVQSSRLTLEIFEFAIAPSVASDLHRVDIDRRSPINEQHKCRTSNRHLTPSGVDVTVGTLQFDSEQCSI